jgi:hypothetical protein
MSRGTVFMSLRDAENALSNEEANLIIAELAYNIGDALFLARRLAAYDLDLILRAALVELTSIDEKITFRTATALEVES